VSVLKEASFHLEQKVNIVVRRGRIVIEPAKVVEYDLNDLLSKIEAHNQHGEVNFGAPVGKESL
jgi:antitoxin MazE